MSETLLLNSLAGVRRRVRLLSFIHGIGRLLAAAVALLVATVFLDYLLNLPPVPRLVIIAAALLTIGYVTLRWVLRPVVSKIRLTDVAGKIEETFPVFDDRLRSVVDFAATQAPQSPESPAMKKRVVAQATNLAGQVDLQSVVRPAPAWNALALGVGCLALCVGLAALIGPDYLNAAFSRLLTPFSGRAWPKRVQIELLGQTPARLAAGSPLEVRIKLIKGDRPSAKAIVFYQYELAGPVQQEMMTRNPDGSYSASLDAQLDPGKADGVMNVWMRSGDDNKQLPPVQIVPPLTIKQVDAVVTPPKYADLPPVTLDLAAAPATVTAASGMQLRVTFSKPIKSVRLQPVGTDGAVPQIRWEPMTSAATTAIGSFIARQPAHFKILASDEDDFSNSGIEEYQILVRPDQLPSVQFEKPVRNQESTAQATIPIQAVAEDDFGVKNLEMVVRRLGDNKSWTLPLIDLTKPAADEIAWQKLDGSGDRLRFRLNWDWDLAKLQDAALKTGDQLEFYLRVQDNYLDEKGNPHNPAYSESGRLRLTIISQDSLSQQINDQLAQLRAQVDDTRKQNESVRSGAKALQQDTANKPALDRADRAMAAQLANDQSAAASQTKQIAARLGELQDRLAQNKSSNTEMANNVAQAKKLLNDAAENPMKDAASKLAEVADPQKSSREQQPQRSAALDQAQRQQTAASSQLQQAMDRMGAQAGISQFLRQVSDLLDQQKKLSNQTAQAGKDTLGKDPSQLTDEQKKTQQDLAKQQQDLAKQTDQATAKMNDSAEKQARTDPASSQALKQAAQTARQQNVSGQMQQAAQAEQQNQQANAQQAQKQSELGLMMMLNQLKDAENRRLMELMKQLDTAQQLVGDLLQQQAGHNLDNLMLQGGNAFAEAVKAGPDLIKELIDFSGRDALHLPEPAPLDTQIALQAQTERNTRNIVSVVQALPEGADPAEQLTRAAQRMSRAITYMQDHRLTDAYQPPQVEAFAALLSAKASLDKQSQQAQQRMQDQQKETLRQQFVQIHDDQVKINDKTKSIDAAPKTDDGLLTHAARANLGILSDQQSDLAKRTAKLNDDLATIGSIAYAYANDDIVTRMGKSKDALGKFDPAKATQSNQARIVRELDDMIKNLSIKPRQSKFANPRNGDNNAAGKGQQQQQAPKLPPEAEIRLIQDLQRMLNDDTKEAAGVPVIDKPAVLDLGKRQGDLRKMLDDLLMKTSNGQTTLGPEPANKQTLPEEATDEDLDLQELKDSALNATPDEQGIKDDTGMLGVRMARARQRLALDADPGKTTQKIQDRIIIEMDGLAKMAQQQQENAQGASRPRPGQGQRQPRPGQQAGNPNNSVAQGQQNQNPRPTPGRNAGGNTAGLNEQGGDIAAKVNDLKESWGKLSPRQRAAVLEGSTDQTIQKFKDYVDGYYRTLAAKTTQQ